MESSRGEGLSESPAAAGLDNICSARLSLARCWSIIASPGDVTLYDLRSLPSL